MTNRRLGYFCAAILLASSFAAPAVIAQSAEAQAGQAAFQARCASCHQPGRLQSYLARRPDDATRQADLEKFLARHHASDAAQRQLIIGWLLGQQARPAP